jgi:hypothetical protein
MTEPTPASRNPSDLARPLHSLLETQLGLKSPLSKAVAALDRAAKLQFNKTVGLTSARAARQVLARAVATGEREFDEMAVREYDKGAIWISSDSPYAENPSTPAAAQLAAEVATQAQQVAAAEVLMHASGIFDTLAAEARRIVGTFEALPEPPRGLFGAGDPVALLTRDPAHGNSYSAVLAATDRFWNVTRGADMVRGAAGHGFERFPDGAPRLAGTYRNWRLAMEKADSDLRTTYKHLRLWRCVLEGWQPGVWKPEDIATVAADRSFSAKLKRFGGAVGIPSGQPAA